MDWYRKIKPKRPRSQRLYVARKHGVGSKPPHTPRLNEVFFSRFSKNIFINGYKAKVINRLGIARLFGLSWEAVRSWELSGVLPEPFMERDYRGKKTRYYLSAQIRCLVRVVNDLVDEGYVNMHWNAMPEHVEMLHNGYAQTLRAFHKRFTAADRPRNAFSVDFL